VTDLHTLLISFDISQFIIKTIGEAIGITNLKDDVASIFACDVEYRLREIAQEAIKFMRHAHRQYLTSDDVNNALRLRNIEVCI
jgi:transcription initiation factor TFIID subunit 6